MFFLTEMGIVVVKVNFNLSDVLILPKIFSLCQLTPQLS
jgi:hypothetical protein